MARIVGDSTHYTFVVLSSEGRPVVETAFRLPSVTHIIKAVMGGGWGPGSYRGFKLGIQSQHPRTDEQKLEELYTKAKRGPWDPNAKLREARDRGVFAHWCAESKAHGYETRTYEDGVSYALRSGNEQLGGYGRAAVGFLEDLNWAGHWEVEAVEKVVYSLKHGFAGTADLILFDRLGIVREVVDFKTHKPNTPEPAFFEDLLQLAAYKLAWNEMYPDAPIVSTRVVVLREDATYSTDVRRVDPAVFLDVKKIWEQMERGKH